VNSPKNPFMPRLEGVALTVTLDGRSLAALTGEEARERDLLMMLAATPVLESLVLDWADAPGPGLSRGYLADPDRDRDLRTIKAHGTDGFFGSVQPWSSRERQADQLGLEGTAREWFLYYETVTWFHRNSSRHYFVTADRRLLKEMKSETHGPRWSGRRIITVRQTLAAIGLMMRSREELYVQAEPHYTRTVGLYDFYVELACALAPARIRLARWVESVGQVPPDHELWCLQESIFDRITDLLRARDAVALQCMRTRQDNATLDEVRYHLRGAMLTITALFDSIAVFASLALPIQMDPSSPPASVSLSRDDFRKKLKAGGGTSLAARASAAGPMFKAVSMLRNPVAHRSGLSGVTYQELPGPTVARVTVSSDQAAALEQAARSCGDPPEQWGLGGAFLDQRLVDPALLVNGLLPRTILLVNDLVAALADDLQAEAIEAPADEGAAQTSTLALFGGLLQYIPSA